MKPVAYISKTGVLFKELPPGDMDLTPLDYVKDNLLFVLTNNGQIEFTQEFESLPSEERLAALNRSMDLIMCKIGQVIDSLEVQ